MTTKGSDPRASLLDGNVSQYFIALVVTSAVTVRCVLGGFVSRAHTVHIYYSPSHGIPVIYRQLLQPAKYSSPVLTDRCYTKMHQTMKSPASSRQAPCMPGTT
ncbi:hypothetical protein PAXRUDRAFT_826729 [Paxillus rubicundulus Ve08.2h10]|uniref:Uncharacterized protein n=1 Tax=Paxillus rubicundulus Ve08.2h10 TaxID=930991 RepID=A0A0D0DE48_9AGAM|nr:hypothetical protein PAXRUDRAFT_826729 [Paxillus rubicundulus Ve08.2h10]